MKKFAILLTALGLSAAAPFASADADGLDLMPKVGGAEITLFANAGDSSVPAASDDSIFTRATGGVETQ